MNSSQNQQHALQAAAAAAVNAASSPFNAAAAQMLQGSPYGPHPHPSATAHHHHPQFVLDPHSQSNPHSTLHQHHNVAQSKSPFMMAPTSQHPIVTNQFNRPLTQVTSLTAANVPSGSSSNPAPRQQHQHHTATGSSNASKDNRSQQQSSTHESPRAKYGNDTRGAGGSYRTGVNSDQVDSNRSGQKNAANNTTGHTPSNNSSGVGDRTSRYNNQANFNNMDNNYHYSTNHDSNNPRMFTTSSQRKLHFNQQNSSIAQNHNHPSAATGGSHVGGGGGAHHSTKDYGGHNVSADPRHHHYPQHHPYHLTQSPYQHGGHAGPQSGGPGSISYHHAPHSHMTNAPPTSMHHNATASVQPYMNRPNHHYNNQHHDQNHHHHPISSAANHPGAAAAAISNYGSNHSQNYPSTSLHHGGGYGSSYLGSGAVGSLHSHTGYNNYHGANYRNYNRGSDGGQYGSGYGYNQRRNSYNENGGGYGQRNGVIANERYNESSSISALNALASKHGLDAAKFTVKNVEYVPSSSDNSNDYNPSGAGGSNSRNNTSQYGGYRNTPNYYNRGNSAGYDSAGLSNYHSTPYGSKFSSKLGKGQGNHYYNQSIYETSTPGNAGGSRNNRQMRSPRLYTVVLEMGGKDFTAQGRSAQHARNLAASKALEEFEKNPPKSKSGSKSQSNNETSKTGSSKTASAAATTSASGSSATTTPTTTASKEPSAKSEEKSKDSAEKKPIVKERVEMKPKSDISQVYEIAQRMNLPVVFEEKYKENNPTGSETRGGYGNKLFIVKCKVGDNETEAQAQGKKYAHRSAAKKMLDILNKLDVPPPRPRYNNSNNNSGPSNNNAGNTYYNQQQQHMSAPHFMPTGAVLGGAAATPNGWRNQQRTISRNNNNSYSRPNQQQNQLKGSSGDGGSGDGGNALNPISRLVQILQLQTKKSPVFTVRSQINGRRSREFHVEVSVGDEKAQGNGNNKRAARRQAALNMLQQMGYTIENKQLMKNGQVVPPPEPNQNPTNKSSLKYRYNNHFSNNQQQFYYQLQNPQQQQYQRRVTFVDGTTAGFPNDGTGGAAGSDLQPGMIHILPKSSNYSNKDHPDVGGNTANDNCNKLHQDLLDEQAGYVAATDINILAKNRAFASRGGGIVMNHKLATQRINAIKIAKELKETQNSETALKLIAESGRKVEDVVIMTSPGSDTKDGDTSSDVAQLKLAPRVQMKLLCYAVGAHLTFQDYTKVGPPLEHVTHLKMFLGKYFHSDATSTNSSEESQDKASESAIDMIANADPNGPPSAVHTPESASKVSTEAGEQKLADSTTNENVSERSEGKSKVERGSESENGQPSVASLEQPANGGSPGSAANDVRDVLSHQTSETSAEHCSENVADVVGVASSENDQDHRARTSQSNAASNGEQQDKAEQQSSTGVTESGATV